MKIKYGWTARVLMFAMVSLLALPVVTSAQGRGRGKPTEIFVNGHDARDGKIAVAQDNWRWEQRRRRDRDDRDDDDRWRRNRRGRNNDDGYGNYGGGFQLRQTALNAGYNDGMEEGRRDRSRGERFEFRDEGDYQNATRDYNSRFGNRELYRTYYRQAFQNGYRDGYGAYGY